MREIIKFLIYILFNIGEMIAKVLLIYMAFGSFLFVLSEYGYKLRMSIIILSIFSMTLWMIKPMFEPFFRGWGF